MESHAPSKDDCTPQNSCCRRLRWTMGEGRAGGGGHRSGGQLAGPLLAHATCTCIRASSRYFALLALCELHRYVLLLLGVCFTIASCALLCSVSHSGNSVPVSLESCLLRLAALLVERALFEIILRLTDTSIRIDSDVTLRDYQPRHGSLWRHCHCKTLVQNFAGTSTQNMRWP